MDLKTSAETTAADLEGNTPIADPGRHPGFSRVSWRRAFNEGGFVFGGQAASAIVGLVGIRVITGLIPQDVFGEASLLLGLMSLGRNLFIAPIGNTQIRFYADYEHRGLGQWFTQQISRLTWMATFVFAAVYGVAFIIWSFRDGHSRLPLICVVVLYLFVDTARVIRSNLLVAERRQSFVAGWVTTESVLSVLCTILCLSVVPSAAAYILGTCIASAISLTIFGVIFHPRLPRDAAAPAHRAEVSRAVVAYGLPFVPMALAAWASNLGDRYMLAAFRSVGEAGTYSAAYGIASRPFIMVSTIFQSFARPILFTAQSKGDYAKAKRVFFLLLMCVIGSGTLGVIAMALFGTLASRLLLAPAYREHAPLIFVWVGVGYALYGVAQVLENRLLSLHRSRSMVMPYVVSTLCNIALNIWVIPRFGAVGAAQTTAIAFLIQSAMLSWLVARLPAQSPTHQEPTT